MVTKTRILAVALLFAGFPAAPLSGQAEPGRTDPMITAARDAATYLGDVLVKAAEQMSEEDYAFRPTPEVRNFGQLLAHIADSNYTFCSAVRGEEPPVREVERTATDRSDIRRALAESFAYCDAAYHGLTEERARSMVPFMGRERPALAVLIFSTHHDALHYGNVVTYMRLRGKVPPSSREPAG